MKYCVLLAFCVVAFSKAVEAIDKIVYCSYSVTVWEPYTCYIEHLQLSAGDTIIIRGEHMVGRTDAHVLAVSFEMSRMHHVPQEIFDKFQNLDRVNARGSNLQTLLPLNHCARLKHFVASNNNLRTVPPNTFAMCRSIDFVILEDNQIVEFNSEGLENLPFLYLGRNPMNATTPESFNHLKRLKSLWLDFNNFNEINPDHFRLPYLESLIMTGNQLTELPADTFKNSPKLRIIFLGQNKIQKIEKTVFHDVKYLFDLNLHGNQIANIDNLFTNNPDLGFLSLSANQIQRLNRNSFAYLNRLEFLALWDNQIEVIEAGAFDGVSYYANILLNGNVCIDQEGPKGDLQLALERCLPHE